MLVASLILPEDIISQCLSWSSALKVSSSCPLGLECRSRIAGVSFGTGLKRQATNSAF